MPHLIATTLIWAFSFPLIGYFISGQIDSFFATFLRVFLAFLVFLPFLNLRAPHALKAQLLGIGALQIGVMYLFYYHAFAYLSVSEVALFTIFTPFYVNLVYDFFARRFRPLYLASVALCVFGAFIIKFGAINSHFLTGFLLIQAANLAFGMGQSLYKITLERHSVASQHSIFGYFHLGATLITGAAFIMLGDTQKLPQSASSWAVLFYLGLVASGLGYFLWNKGATLVDSGILAIMNNAVIPTAIIANALFIALFLPEKSVNFSPFELARFALGTLIMFLALWLHYKIIKRYEKMGV